jgi:signal transduction histidine kinase
MSSVSASRPPERALRAWRGISLLPRTLFGRVLVSVLAAVFLAQAITFTLVARDRDRLLVEGNVREWSRRIVDLTFALQLLDADSRSLARARLNEWPPDHLKRHSRVRPLVTAAAPVPDFRDALERELALTLGPSYHVDVVPTADPGRRVITVMRQPPEGYQLGGKLFDVNVALPDGDALQFRVAQGRRGPLLPRNLLLNLILLTAATGIAVYVLARSITRPLSDLAQAAEAVGRDVRQPPLRERGTRELREAARAFNTMRDRMHRYLDSRTRVFAAMSHDLKTPLTRMRLRVETLEDDEIRARFGSDLDEMEGMVRGTLALLKGLTDDEGAEPIDIAALLATLQLEFAELGARVQIVGRATESFSGRPQALKRCLTNLLSNAIKFGTRATVVVEDDAALVLRVQDEGPGLPPGELERVFEPFYRVESSRNRDTGGSGLGLSIARDIAQVHGGSLILRNMPRGGLEAILTLPRVQRVYQPVAQTGS